MFIVHDRNHILYNTFCSLFLAFCEKCGLGGANLDVMKRILQVGEYGNFDTLVRVTGDSPLISVEYIEKMLNFHFSKNLEYTRLERIPVGMEAEVIDLTALELIHRAVIDKKRTELLTWYLDSNGTFNNGIMSVRPEDRLDHYRLTLDYLQYLDLMKTIANDLHFKSNEFYIPTQDILNWLRENQPEWREQKSFWSFSREDINTNLKYMPKKNSAL